MIIVKTKLKETKNKGIGLFADQFIPKGEMGWKESVSFDKVISLNEYNSYSELQKDFYKTYCFVKKDGTLYMCADNARFINHSNTPNTGNIGDDCLVLRDIQKDEE